LAGERRCVRMVCYLDQLSKVVGRLLTISCRSGPDRGGDMLLQGLEGLSATGRPDKHLRQNSTEAGA